MFDILIRRIREWRLTFRSAVFDLLAPVWNFMDLTPQGRGAWYASLSYGTKARS